MEVFETFCTWFCITIALVIAIRVSIDQIDK